MIIWPAKIRRRFEELDIDKLENYLKDNGYNFQFEGGLTKEEDTKDSWFKYIHYWNPKNRMKIRICYFMNRSNIKEIMTWNRAENQEWGDSHYPDFRYNKWKNIRK